MSGKLDLTMERARDLARSYLYGAMGHLGISVLKDEAVESIASRLFDDFSRNWWEHYPLCICSHGILDHEGGPVMQGCERCSCMKYVAVQPAAQPQVRELLTKHEYSNGTCLCREFKLPPYGTKELEEFRAQNADEWMRDIRWHYWLKHIEAALAASSGASGPELKQRELIAKWMNEFHSLSAIHYGGEGERIGNVYRVCAEELERALPKQRCLTEKEHKALQKVYTERGASAGAQDYPAIVREGILRGREQVLLMLSDELAKECRDELEAHDAALAAQQTSSGGAREN